MRTLLLLAAAALPASDAFSGASIGPYRLARHLGRSSSTTTSRSRGRNITLNAATMNPVTVDLNYLAATLPYYTGDVLLCPSTSASVAGALSDVYAKNLRIRIASPETTTLPLAVGNRYEPNALS